MPLHPRLFEYIACLSCSAFPSDQLQIRRLTTANRAHLTAIETVEYAVTAALKAKHFISMISRPVAFKVRIISQSSFHARAS